MDPITPLDLPGYNPGSKLIGLFLGFEWNSAPVLEFVISAPPGNDYRKNVKQGWLDGNQVPAIHMLIGVDTVENNHKLNLAHLFHKRKKGFLSISYFPVSPSLQEIHALFPFYLGSKISDTRTIVQFPFTSREKVVDSKIHLHMGNIRCTPPPMGVTNVLVSKLLLSEEKAMSKAKRNVWNVPHQDGWVIKSEGGKRFIRPLEHS